VREKSGYKTVKLSGQEMVLAAMCGVMRHVKSTLNGHEHKPAPKGKAIGWQRHCEGALGERAVAKSENVYWDASNGRFGTRAGADVGSGLVQVRTRSMHHYDLLIRPYDDPKCVYVHVTGTAPEYRIWGWLYGHEAMRDEYKQTYGGMDAAYFVPASALRKMETLDRKVWGQAP